MAVVDDVNAFNLVPFVDRKFKVMGTLYWMVNCNEPKTCNPAEDQSTQAQQCVIRVWMIMIRHVTRVKNLVQDKPRAV